MNKDNIIKKIEKRGLKEYQTSSLESYERAWQKKFTDDIFINVNFWEHSKFNNFVTDSFEIEIYRNNNDGAEKILIYGFKNFDKAYSKALQYINCLKK